MVQEKVVLEKEGLVSHQGGLWVVSCHGFCHTETMSEPQALQQAVLKTGASLTDTEV